jgi:hypothetical protein
MSGFTSAGNNIKQRITFNSGTLDFGSSRAVEVDNITIDVEYTLLPLYVLNSIKPQDYTRASQKVAMTGKIKSFAPELYDLALGSSTIGTPQEIDTLDGQPTLVNPVLTFFDRNNNQYQYQFSGALFKSYKMNAKMEDYAEWDIELEAKDITLIYTA